MAFFLTKDGGELVGGSGLHKADWTLRQFEVGYWGRARFAGSGLMTEGVRALARHAIEALGAHRVFLTTDERNLRSRRLAERAGFEIEGTLRNDRLDLEGRLRNTRVYAIVSSARRRNAPAMRHSSRPAGVSSHAGWRFGCR